ncbi:MAG: TraR/DksA family transcriptional regulator [Steroidobacteraceae bacterium]|jgi:RNA polymerase-binding protein DksA|nr:TraR/DksA family transcriptional regulator [Steroidobacteraceae bacterium]
MERIDSNQLAGYRDRLLERDRHLRSEIDATRLPPEEAGPANIVGGVRDSGEDSVAIHEQELNYADLARDVNELNEIAAALDRIRDGGYGTCENCGGEIARARLDAQPTARRCIRCQSSWEKTHVGRPAPTL